MGFRVWGVMRCPCVSEAIGPHDIGHCPLPIARRASRVWPYSVGMSRSPERHPYFASLPRLGVPGLFVTATDTDVGKTVVSCAMAWSLRRRGSRVGVSKPYSSGCDVLREGLVNPDAEALAHFADCRATLETINPIRYRAAVAPGVAAAGGERAGAGPGGAGLGPGAGPEADRATGVSVAAALVARLGASLSSLASGHEVLIVEGAGGVMVPLDGEDVGVTVLTLAAALDLPAVVVARSTLGTLNHTALTVAALREAGCRVAGVVMNGFDAEDGSDDSIGTNRQWIERMTGADVLAVLPRVDGSGVRPRDGVIDAAILEAADTVDWARLARPARRA